ncbi:hypothetical protein LDENG_00231540 [Lucifuga dentata]|nr:hypothetical protein LDENG_00231540 [Lucifuga dentata]
MNGKELFLEGRAGFLGVSKKALAVFCNATKGMVFALHVIVMSSAFFNPSFAFSSHFDTVFFVTTIFAIASAHMITTITSNTNLQ